MSEALLIDRDGAVATWTLNLPEQRNPISDPTVVEALVAAIDAANTDPELAVIILTGAGKGFSAGGNVKDMAAGVGMFGGSGMELRSGYEYGIQQIPRAMQRLAVPIIAAVNGSAVGAGCDLACMCDLRIASENAFFAESFVKLGIIPGDGGAWFLPRLIGRSRAAEMTLTGDRVDARTALEWGLVSQVVAAQELLPAARTLADRIAANSLPAVRLAKRLLRESDGQRLDTVLELSAAYQALAHQTPEHRSALDAQLNRGR